MADSKLLSYGGPIRIQASPSFSTFALNQSTDAMEWPFQAEGGVVITKVGYRFASSTGSTASLKASLQGVDGTGIPDGTIKGGGSPASVTHNPVSLGWGAGTFNWLTLDNAFTVPNNDNLLCLVVAADSGVDGSNTITISYRLNAPAQLFPYSITNDAGARTRQQGAVFGYASSSRAYGCPIQVPATVAFNSGTGTADEYGIKFTVPSAWLATYQIIGIRFVATMAAGGSVLVGLYGGTDATAANSTGATSEVTLFQSYTHDQDVTQGTTGYYTILFDESSLTTLYGDAVYRLSFQPQNANNFTMLYSTAASASDWDAFEGGRDFSKCLRLNVGNWSADVTTDRPAIELILRDITKPAGGGSTGGFVIGG